VLRKKGDELYNRVAHFEAEWLGKEVRNKIVRTLSAPVMLQDNASKSLNTSEERRKAGENFLKELKLSWEDHQVCMGMLTDVLMYMVSHATPPLANADVMTPDVKDRVYCTDHRQPSIYAKSMGLFRDQILLTPVRAGDLPLLDILTRTILEQIQMDRDGEGIDHFLIKSNVYMLEGLYNSDLEVEDEKLYLQAFEREFLESSAAFYRDEGDRLLRESDAGQYCRHAKRRIDEEHNRCRSTLSESTAPKIQRVVEEELIRHKMKGLIEMETGVAAMVDNDKFDDLGLVFELEARVDAKKPELTRALQKIVNEMGTNINNSAVAASQAQAPATSAGAEEGGEDEQQENNKTKPGATRVINQQTLAALKWVADILALKDRFDKIFHASFDGDQSLSTAINRSMADVINAFSRGSEYISLFIDDNMKKGIKDKTEAEIDKTLEKAIVVLRYLQDKDVFETYYKKHLCKRLILKKSHSIDVEKQMISRMKIELGNSFTLKLEAMFKDMTLSDELSAGFREHLTKMGDRDPKRADLTVKVLTSMTWPLEAFRGGHEENSDQRPQIILAPSIQRLKTGFEQYYSNKYSGRKLTWVNSMGDADIKARFPNSRHPVHELNCSTYAMLVLLLFNNLPSGASLTLEEIQAQTNIPLNDLSRNLQSLAVAPKTRLLVKEPMSREINPRDCFRFNEDFTSKTMKIKIGVVSAGNKVETDRERKETEKKNNDSRSFVIEAAIVRIMK
jgi:cullin 3